MTPYVNNRRLTRIGGAAAALAVASLALPMGVAHAEGGDDVDVLNTETVQVYTDASGEVEDQRIYEQLALRGKGSVEFDNPVGSSGLRNLDGFAGFEVSDGVQHVTAEVDGAEHLRSVSDYDGDLPLDLSIEYRLDGEVVRPGDVVGESGELEVTYTVKNVTGEPQEISYPDGDGGTVTETVDVPLPIVGSVSTTLPSSFTEVTSDGANMAGDGQGGTKLSFTMTLLAPIGSDTATFGYTATVKDAVVPPASITALPVDPMQNPTFKGAADSYQGGADTGVELADGAREIDANLLRIRDGAAELLSGLVQLHEGSQELSAGLQGEAAPGGEALAAGARELRDGLGQIDDGAGQLSGGLAEAGSKAPALLDGLQQLRAGLKKVDSGLGELYNGLGAVETNPDYKRLLAGLDKMLAGVGTRSAEGTLTWAVDQLRIGFESAVPKIQKMADGVYNNETPGAYQKLGCAVKVVDLLNDGIGDSTDPCLADIVAKLKEFGLPLEAVGAELNPVRKEVLSGLADQLEAGRQQLATPDGATNETTLYGGLQTLLGQLTRMDPKDPGAIPALTSMECALDDTSLGGTCSVVRPGETGLRQGLEQVVAGIPKLVNTIVATVQAAVGQGRDTPSDETLRGGMSGLLGGVDEISDGGSTLIDGLGQLSAGAGELAAGTGEASDGSGRLADGAGELAAGLGDAAEGSGRLEDGLRQAREAAPALPQGAERLSEEGMSKLVEAGKGTAKDYGKLYATVAAGSERAQAGTMAFGAPEDARGLMAYSFEIKGEDGEGSRNVARGVGALVLGGLGLGAVALRRRLF